MFEGLAEAAGWRRPLPVVEKGGVYCRNGSDKAYEWATVLAVQQDHRGIPHVTYQALIGWGEGASMTSQRTLTLAAFVKHYGISKQRH
ncbi:MAG: hypothetical protein WD489_03025 [Rhodovibrionaceae bacterium]